MLAPPACTVLGGTGENKWAGASFRSMFATPKTLGSCELCDYSLISDSRCTQGFRQKRSLSLVRRLHSVSAMWQVGLHGGPCQETLVSLVADLLELCALQKPCRTTRDRCDVHIALPLCWLTTLLVLALNAFLGCASVGSFWNTVDDWCQRCVGVLCSAV